MEKFRQNEKMLTPEKKFLSPRSVFRHDKVYNHLRPYIELKIWSRFRSLSPPT